MAVGSPYENVSGKSSAGMVFVYESVNGTWIKRATLVGSSVSYGSLFGSSVSLNGNKLIVGSPGENHSGKTACGSAYVFEMDSENEWSETQVLRQPNGENDGDRFGTSVSLRNDRAVIGAPFKTVDGKASAGEAFVFERSGDAWSFSEIITHDSLEAGDCFGWSVALSGDVSVIGAKLKDFEDRENSGAAYVFEKTGDEWTKSLTVQGSEAGGELGVAVSIYDDIIAVGAFKEDWTVEDSGAVHIIERIDGNWEETSILKGDPQDENDYFGCSVSVWRNRLVVGAFSRDDLGSSAGAVFSFSKDPWTGKWKKDQTLYGSLTSANDQFGYSVALSNERLVVGANLEDPDGNVNAGAVFSFNCEHVHFYSSLSSSISSKSSSSSSRSSSSISSYSSSSSSRSSSSKSSSSSSKSSSSKSSSKSSSSSELPTYLSMDEVVEISGSLTNQSFSNDAFGFSVADDGENIFVGAPGQDFSGAVDSGAAYVFSGSEGSWTETQALSSPNSEFEGGFGSVVKADDGWLLIGACSETVSGNAKAGRAYLYKNVSGEFVLDQEMTSPLDPSTDCKFAFSVDVRNDIIAVGEPSRSEGSLYNSGKVHLYVQDGGVWSLEQTLSSSIADVNNRFGSSVAVGADTVVIGEPNANDTGLYNCGAISIFKRTDGVWSQSALFKGSQDDSLFGASVAVENDIVAVGAQMTTLDTHEQVGAVFVFELEEEEWVLTDTIYSPLASSGDEFGSSISIMEDVMFVGAPHAGDGVNDSGICFEFKRDFFTKKWILKNTIISPTVSYGDQFSFSIAARENSVVIGSPFDDPDGKTDGGSAFIYGSGVSYMSSSISSRSSSDSSESSRSSSSSSKSSRSSSSSSKSSRSSRSSSKSSRSSSRSSSSVSAAALRAIYVACTDSSFSSSVSSSRSS